MLNVIHGVSMMHLDDVDAQIEAFLAGAPHAVVGASQDRSKYGNKVLRSYQQDDRPVFAINPRGESIEGAQTFASLEDVPDVLHGISVITPPHITEKVIAEAIDLGIQHIWLQPGAESAAAMQMARDAKVNLIANGPCVLVILGFRSAG